MAFRVPIIGGYGGMGQIFARLFLREGLDVTIAGPTVAKGVEAARKLGVRYVKDNVAAVAEADIVVITVPIDRTEKTIREVAPHVKDGALLMDLTSVKGWPCKEMLKHSKPGVEVVGTHPVFGPRVGSVDGQVFVLTPVRGVKWLAWIRELLGRHRARVVEATPEEHDRVMGVVQGLTHFTYISVGKTLKDLNFDVKRSRDFSSPIYELMLDMIGRIIGQDPRLYAEIQMTNPQVLPIHEAYMKAARELSDSVRKKDEELFVRMMSEAARHFDDTERAMGRSDKAISSLAAELHTLKDSIGKKACMRHIYSGTTHYGIVESVSADEVVIVDGSKRQKLKLSNLRVLAPSERKKYRVEKYGTVKRDYSVLLPDTSDESFLRELLVGYDEGIVSADVKDVYTGDKIGSGKKSVCFSVELLQDELKETQDKVARLLKAIGGTLR